MPKSRICSVDGCDNPHDSRGYCGKHAARVRRRGDPGAVTRAEVGEPLRFFQEVVLSFRGDECLGWPYARNANGYGIICLNGKSQLVHRMACQARHGAPESSSLDACHNCNNPSCVNPDHQRWGTRADNFSDKLANGTDNRGEKSPIAKLTADDVRLIRSLMGYLSFGEVATMFGVSNSCIYKIWHRKSWFWLE